MIVGPTGTGFTATLTREHDFLLVKQRGDARLLVSHKNVGPSLDQRRPPVAPEIPDQLLKMFYEYRDQFGALKNARL